MKNKNQWVDTLPIQYREEIKKISARSGDPKQLTQNLLLLKRIAKAEGLEEVEFEELVKNTIPITFTGNSKSRAA